MNAVTSKDYVDSAYALQAQTQNGLCKKIALIAALVFTWITGIATVVYSYTLLRMLRRDDPDLANRNLFGLGLMWGGQALAIFPTAYAWIRNEMQDVARDFDTA